MRPGTLTQRRSRQPTAVGMSLFPFLAVLICTMGALILLLVVITHQAQLQAAQTADAETAQKRKQIEEAREEAQWRIELLQESREKTQAELDGARLALGHVEDHARRLVDRLAQLEAALAQLDRAGSADAQHRARLEAELRGVQADVAEVARQLDDAKANAEKRRRSYAVVPYQGPHETSRRPIYIECTADAVILQAEGVALQASDFEGPMGPGNPLAAGLRAAREYLLEKRGFDPRGGSEPYPLLLVRPSGIDAYYAARSAMKAWGPEFGYELIGDDWQLEFQPADAELADVMRRAIEAARRRQQRLAAAAPRYYGGGTQTRYRASPSRGGVIPDGGLFGEADSTGSSHRSGGGFGSPGGPGGRGSAERTAPYDGSIYGPAGGDGPDRGSAQGVAGSGGGDDGSGDPGLGGSGRAGRGQGSTGPAGTGVDGTSAGGTALEGGSSGGAGHAGGSGGGNMSIAAGAPGGGSAGGSDGEAGLIRPDAENFQSAGGVAAATAGAGESTSPGQGGSASESDKPPLDQPPVDQSSISLHPPHPRRTESLAHKRGTDWALRNASRAAVPITRPIRVDCYRDRLVIVPEQGLLGGKTISLRPRTATSIDSFVMATWEYMDSWGIAGRGMYWCPVLNVYVAPDAEGRFLDLSLLLEGSGLKVERKEVVSGQ